MRAYYNEIDADAAGWLRELIARGELPDGEVDERSIVEVDPADLGGFDQCHFFAGIGGWALALRLAGWPDDVPVWTGSCPCQPFSAAGAQAGSGDDRHLWPAWHRLIEAARPAFIYGEQVASALAIGRASRKAGGGAGDPPEWAWLDAVWTDLEDARYAVGAAAAPACGVGAPHIRLRTWFGAVRLVDRVGPRLEGLAGHVADGAGRAEAARPASAAGGPGGLADGFGAGSQGRPGREGQAARDHARGAVHDGGLADAEAVGQEHGDGGGGAEGSGPASQGRREQAGAGRPHGGLADAGEGERGRVAGGEGRHDDGPAPGRIEGDRGPARNGAGGGLADALETGRSVGGAGDDERRHAGHGGIDLGNDPSGRRPHDGLADADGGDARAEREQPGGKLGLVAEDGGAGGLADAAGRAGQPGLARPVERPVPAGDGGGDAPAGRPDPLDGGWSDVDWLFCRDGKWRPVESRPEPLADGLPAGVGPGGDLFSPLAPKGSPDAEARTMRLRGYGNAIVPQLGAAFILSFLDALETP